MDAVGFESAGADDVPVEAMPVVGLVVDCGGCR